MRRHISALFCGLAVTITLAFGEATVSRWNRAPAKDHARINPFAGDASAVEGGAALYKDHCLQCHGRDLSGDGKKVPSLKTSEIRNASDGDLEWFLRQGDLRHGMPSWSGLPLAQRWQIITYLRSLQR
jgi:mono/diheme cytochrome c family protein